MFRDTEWAGLVESWERFGLPDSVHRPPFVVTLESMPMLQTAKAVCFGSCSLPHAAKPQG